MIQELWLISYPIWALVKKNKSQKNIQSDPNFYLKNMSHIWSFSSFPKHLSSCLPSVF